MNATTTVPRPNTRDMVGVHQVFREAFGCAAQLVGSVCGDRTDRTDAVTDYYANVLAMLRVHHQGEDELLWPKLSERAPHEAVLVARMQGQHEGLHDALSEAERRLVAWRAQCDIDHGAALAAALAALGVMCAAHFDEEERRILPLAAELCTVEEWSELPAHAMRNFDGDKVWLVIGLVQEQMPPQARELMEAAMPAPLRDMWHGAGRAQFDEFVARLRG